MCTPGGLEWRWPRTSSVNACALSIAFRVRELLSPGRSGGGVLSKRGEMAHLQPGQLTFDQFVAALPARVREVRKPSEFRQWFDQLDANALGWITMSAFFAWSMSADSIVSGSGAKRVFMRFDTDVCTRVGIAAVGRPVVRPGADVAGSTGAAVGDTVLHFDIDV